ncbi:hypothetical protein Gotur_033953 [Gossypium turneri]
MPRRRLLDLSIIQNPPNSEETNSEQQTAVGFSNVLNIVDEPVEIQTESGGRHKTRGRTLLKDLSQNLNMLPINYESWHHMPDSNKNQALNNIKVIT